MTINEKKQLSNYIKGLIRESISEMSLPKGFNYMDELPDEFDNRLDDMSKPTEEGEFPWPEKEDLKPFGGEMENPRSHYEGPDVDGNNDPAYDENEEEPAGLDELRQLAESYARESVAQILSEKKKGGWKNKGKKKKGEKKKSSAEKTLMNHLNKDSVNAAHYYYKLWGAKTDAEKAAARSLGYKKAKGEKTPNKKSHYRFTSKERNKLHAMLTTDKN